ncbi:hypothetical protein DNTS_011841 [Danionella cerebrum]|nr:hypothetical protein DNTS_011841 [Danionella translucida]
MEEALINTEHSQHGTSTQVKLPNFTEDVDRQGLVDLYSVNETLYGQRHNYSPNLDDWINFWKDVDSMFALLRNFKRLNKTDKLVGLAELGSGDLEEASGTGFSIPEEPTQSPVTTGPSTAFQESHFNELPKGRPTKGSTIPRGDTWVRQLEMELDDGGMTFSGNGVTELETRHDFLLRSSRILDLHPQEEEEDIFQAQGYLVLSPQPETVVEPTPAQSSIPQERLNASVLSFSRGPSDVQDVEGSASGLSH